MAHGPEAPVLDSWIPNSSTCVTLAYWMVNAPESTNVKYVAPEGSQSMRVGFAAVPTAWNPAPAAISSLERLLLKLEPVVAANCSFFWTLVSLDAAIVAKLPESPG